MYVNKMQRTGLRYEPADACTLASVCQAIESQSQTLELTSGLRCFYGRFCNWNQLKRNCSLGPPDLGARLAIMFAISIFVERDALAPVSLLTRLLTPPNVRNSSRGAR